MKKKSKKKEVKEKKVVPKVKKEASKPLKKEHSGVLNPVTINEYMDRSTQEVLDSIKEDGSSYSRDDIQLVLDYERQYQNRAEIIKAVKSMKKKEREENPTKFDVIKKSVDSFLQWYVFSRFKWMKEKFTQVKLQQLQKNHVKKVLSDAEKKIRDKEERKEEIRKKLDMAQLKKIQEKAKKHKGPKVRYKLRTYLDKAGLTLDSKVVAKRLFDISILLNLAISIYVIYYFSVNYNYTLYYAIINMLLLWTVVFAGLLVLVWLSFHLILDLRIFHRKISIETVLPDFLQLTSANIRAGMPIDQSLWYAVRPRFGILSKEIEMVAKKTMSGEDLKEALQSFTDQYDSKILKRSFNLLIEGMEAGGEVGDLLNKISINISEANILKKEMAANVTTYVIFIMFATLVAAPFLFALSSQLLAIMTSLSATVDIPAGSLITFSGVGITPGDFRIYSLVSLITTAFFSAMIISTIKKGNVKEGLGSIPKFVIVVVLVYYFAIWVLSKFFANVI